MKPLFAGLRRRGVLGALVAHGVAAAGALQLAGIVVHDLGVWSGSKALVAKGAGKDCTSADLRREAIGQRRWICIIEAPKVGRLGGTAEAMTMASPRIASPAPTRVCAMFAIISSVVSNGFFTCRADTPQ